MSKHDDGGAASDVICPFCREGNFDLYGLQLHLLRGWCEIFPKLTDPAILATLKTPETHDGD